MRRLFVALSAAALILAVAVPATSASIPRQVTITSVITITGNGTNTGTFVAEGPAVTRGLICASGTVTDVYLDWNAYPTDFAVVKAFVCDIGGPTFLVKLQVPSTTEAWTWAAQGGSGPYRSLFGSGTGYSEAGPAANQVTDHYTGTVFTTSGQNSQS